MYNGDTYIIFNVNKKENKIWELWKAHDHLLHLCTCFFIATIAVIISVSCINELNPVGTTLAFTFTVFENSPVDTPVGKLTLTNGGWLFNNIKYTIGRGNLDFKFYIEQDTSTVKMLVSVTKIKNLHAHLNVFYWETVDSRNLFFFKQPLTINVHLGLLAVSINTGNAPKF